MLTNNFAGLVSLNCQLGSGNYTVCKTTENVAPFVGAWIEIRRT